MSLLKNVAFALSLSTAMMAVAPTAMAGKIAHQTAEEAVQAIDDTLASAEATMKAMRAGEDKSVVKALVSETKQFTKTIESATTYSTREKDLSKLKSEGRAYRDDV